MWTDDLVTYFTTRKKNISAAVPNTLGPATSNLTFKLEE